MSFDLHSLQQDVTESGLEPSARSMRVTVNDFMDAHPLLRADLIAIAYKRDTYPEVYDQKRDMEIAIRDYDEKNGHVLSTLTIAPSRLVKYARDRVNTHLLTSAEKRGASEAPRIVRGRISAKPLLTSTPAPAPTEDSAEA